MAVLAGWKKGSPPGATEILRLWFCLQNLCAALYMQQPLCCELLPWSSLQGTGALFKDRMLPSLLGFGLLQQSQCSAKQQPCSTVLLLTGAAQDSGGCPVGGQGISLPSKLTLLPDFHLFFHLPNEIFFLCSHHRREWKRLELSQGRDPSLSTSDIKAACSQASKSPLVTAEPPQGCKLQVIPA